MNRERDFVFPQGLKPATFVGDACGTAEAVPSQDINL
jgi:hypothetical protein